MEGLTEGAQSFPSISRAREFCPFSPREIKGLTGIVTNGFITLYGVCNGMDVTRVNIFGSVKDRD